MSRDFTYVDGVIKIIDNPSQEFNPENPNPSISTAPYKIYNIGNNTPVQLLDLEIKIGIKAKKDFMDMQDGDVVSTYADTNDFNYKLADGVEQFVVWYRKFYGRGN